VSDAFEAECEFVAWMRDGARGVTVIHRPSGLEAECSTESTQIQNRSVAIEELRRAVEGP
jgi:protein subunit release factor A